MYFECVPHVSATDHGMNIIFLLIDSLKKQIKTTTTTKKKSVALVLEGKCDSKLRRIHCGISL